LTYAIVSAFVVTAFLAAANSPPPAPAKTAPSTPASPPASSPTKTEEKAATGRLAVPAKPGPQPVAPGQERKSDKMMYTTYFYTAAEAIVHAYEDGTKVRVARIEGDKGTIWQGVLNRGQTQLVSTGLGVFAFFSDKKAALLVGTPTSCSAVGYFAADETGSFRADHFLTALSSGSPKVIVWAWEETGFRVFDRSNQTELAKGKLGALKYHELTAESSHVLEVTADKKAIAVQIYDDEGYSVPARDGRSTGRDFMTYVGTRTNGQNDLELFAYGQGAAAKVVDLVDGSTVWEGNVPGNGAHTLTLSGRYVRITATQDLSVSVAPYEHYKGGYAEHHYAAGREGTGIDREFLVTTPQELWIFSYYGDNEVTVQNLNTAKKAWHGKLGVGAVAALAPGWGLYQVKSGKGISVMAGCGSCGAAFSPAGGMFTVDETLFAVIRQIKEERQQRAQQEGRKLTAAEAEAPLSRDELKKVTQTVQSQTTAAAARSSASGPASPAPAAAPPASMTDDEIRERARSIEQR
jgi:hypothetical protein